MNILLKNKKTLTQLFSTLSVQEMLLVNQNLILSWHLFPSPSAQFLSAMKEEQVNIEYFLAKKCLPLIRFYLADTHLQKAIFLSTELLAGLLMSLPTVEAIIFKGQIHNAQLTMRHENPVLLSFSDGGLAKNIETNNSVMQLNSLKSSKLKVKAMHSVGQLAKGEKQYLNYFYYLDGGELFIAPEQKTIDVDMLLYRELSPLQQLDAQKLI